MPRSDPFRGIRLSEQASTQRIEQRLFAPAPPAKPIEAAKPAPSAPEEPPPPAKPQSRPPTDPRVEALRPRSIREPRFDLSEQPLYKASFLFTQEELEALEDLKLELRRELDRKVTKNDLARCALHMLAEDYAASGPRGYAGRKLRGR